jgi:hypothetical protein
MILKAYRHQVLAGHTAKLSDYSAGYSIENWSGRYPCVLGPNAKDKRYRFLTANCFGFLKADGKRKEVRFQFPSTGRIKSVIQKTHAGAS